MDPSEPKKPFHTRMVEKLAASRFFTFSALIHVVIIFLGGSVVLFKHYAEPPDFAATDGGLVTSDVQVEAPPEQPPDVTQQTFQPTAPQINAPSLNAISTTNLSTPTFQVAQAAPVIKAPPADAMNKALEKATQSMARGVTGNIPATMGSRMGGTARAQAMTMNGGKKESEEAVQRGLRWLVKNQNPDGSWGTGYKGAMTGFGLLSFLGHGETPVSPEFGPAVQKALEWLMKGGAKFEGRLSMQAAFNQPGVYEHAIATYALGEYYTMTKDERVVDLLKHAVGYIVDGQSPDGGWVYGYTKEGDGDTSVTGWQIQALKAAHLTGLNIPGVDQALDKAMLDLKRVQGPKGGFGYRTPGDGYSLAGVGVLCTYFWKQEKDKSVRTGIEFIMDQTDKTYPIEYQNEKANLYAWYYNTQACLMVGGAAWTKWNRLFQTEITKAQAPDGSWPVMKAKSPGELQSNPTGIGPFYRTNLCILMLEVYYRYMPSTK
jgi:hypothetical protein